MKRAQLPVALIFTVVIAIAGIMLVFLLAGNLNDSQKKSYCRNFYDRQEKYDPYCEEFLQLEQSYLSLKQGNVTEFSGKKRIMQFTGPGTASASFRMISNATVESARLNISLYENTIKTFITGYEKELLIVPPFRQEPGPGMETEVIPADSSVTSAKMEIYGRSSPTRADVAYVIDTSRSMINEWSTLCDTLDEITQQLDDIGLDIEFYFYALGSGEAIGDCWDMKLGEPELMPVRALTEMPGGWNVGCSPNFCMTPYDDYEEAWASGISWIANNHVWRDGTDVKRIIIPISDSDPTGGGPTTGNSGGDFWNNKYTGSEQPSIDQAIADCQGTWPAWHYVLPIQGDEVGEPAEGYGVGKTPCTGMCTDIWGWMKQLVEDTTGSETLVPVPFSDRDTIFDSILSIVTTPYPKDIVLNLNGMRIWEMTGFLDDTNSQQVVMDPAFASAVQATCRGNPCMINIVSDEGTVIFDKLRIKYLEDPSLSELRINGISIPVHLDYADPSVILDITDELTEALAACDQSSRFCDITFEFAAGKEGSLDLSELLVQYQYYPLEEELADKIISCWIASSQGMEEESFMCEEFHPKGELPYPVDEAAITAFLKESNTCHIIGNSDFDCGDDDDLRLAQDIYRTQNILIEYDAGARQVVVS